MVKIVLNILASDIKETDYLRASDCAITRALLRAGYPNLIDCGTEISKKKSKLIVDSYIPFNYNILANKVMEMYEDKGEIEDFTYEIEVPEEFVN
jgi:hypothetical protein